MTDESSPSYIPPADRIATFDLDGTLIGELFPTYLENVLLMRRIFYDPSYSPDEDMYSFGIMLRDHALDWKTIYGENVVKTGQFHWLEDYSDDKISARITTSALNG